MNTRKESNDRFMSPFVHSSRHLLGAALLLLLCSNAFAAQQTNYAPETVTIELPDGSEMRFKAVYLGIEKDKKDKKFPSLFASRRFTLGSREASKHTYKQQQVDINLAGSFIGTRNGQPDWLYYLGETEVSRGQWNSVMRWMDEQEGKTPAANTLDAKQEKLPQTGITVAKVYRFIEGLNILMLKTQKEKLPKLGQSYAFCRLPTEAEWAFAARGGINVLERYPYRFDRRNPYPDEIGNYEWNSGNSGGKPNACGSNALANPIGLRDMLGNVEELTISLFGPQYVHGRLGQFAIRGNSFGDAADAFDVSSRTEFVSYDNNGNFTPSDKVGFRLALSSSVSASAADPDVLDSEYQHYTESLESTEPSLVGSSTPALLAEQNSREYYEKQLNIFRTDVTEKDAEISRLKNLRSEDQKALSETKQTGMELRYRKERLEAQLAVLQEQLDARPKPDTIEALQQQLSQKETEIHRLQEERRELTGAVQNVSFKDLYDQSQKEVEHLRDQLIAAPSLENLEQYKQKNVQLQKEKAVLADELADLKLSEKKVKNGVLVVTENLEEVHEELKRKDQRIADLERRQAEAEDKIAENDKFAQLAERRYLEALMRLAYTNAFHAYKELVKMQHTYLDETGKYYSEDKAAKAYSQACQLLHDYWKLVVKIAEDTRPDLFSEVKKEVADWLQTGEKENRFAEECRGQELLNPLQRQSLDLIERHVKRVRDRKSGRKMPDDLIDTFIEQKEFQ